jgi:hypothetical protein
MHADETLCPPHIRESLNDYVLRGIETGSFLRAVLENNLTEAVTHADRRNILLLRHIVAWVYNNVPSNVCGSAEAVRWHLMRTANERAALTQPVPPQM